ncbi:restriction endonuclease subunit S, partial [Avibacterium avium]
MKLKLKDLVKIKGGKRLPKGSNLQTIPNKHPYIKVKDMKNKFISLDGLEYVPDEIFTKIKNYIVNENDIIISIVGTIGLVSIIDSKLNNASQTENCAKLSGLDYIDSEYLYYFLISEYGQSEINKATVGAVQPKLPLYGIENIEIDWKTREDREKIIYILRNIDNKIELNTQTNQTLEQIAQGIFKHWFIDFAPVHAKANALARGETTEQAELAAMACLSGKTVEKITALKTQDPTAYHQLQQTAAAFPSEFVETEMGKVPKGWEWLKIENIISRLKNKQKINKNDISDIGNIPVFEQGQNILMGYHSDNPAFIATSQDPIFIFGDHTCITHISTKPFSIYQNVIPIKGKDIPTLWVYLAVKDKQKFQEYRRHWMEFIIKEICLPNRELIE